MLAALLFPGLLACHPDTTPTWAFDPLWVEPAVDDGAHGFHTWQLYGPKWIDNYKENTYACAVVTEVDGAATTCDAAPDCVVAWEVVEEVVESDCGDPALEASPLFVSLQRLAIAGPDGSPEAPWPGSTSVAWADYGNGWEIYGAAYPEALDLGGDVTTAEWDGVQPFLMVPNQSFPVEPGGSTATPGLD